MQISQPLTEAFAALGDPTRLAILSRLATQGDLTVQEIVTALRNNNLQVAGGAVGAPPFGNSPAAYQLNDREIAQSFPASDRTWQISLTASQVLYSGGGVSAAVRGSKLGREAAVLDLQAVINDAMLQVRTAFYAVLLAQEKGKVQESNLELLQQQLKTVSDRFEAGTVSSFEKLRAEVAVANAKVPLITARNDHRLAIEALRHWVVDGREPSHAPRLQRSARGWLEYDGRGNVLGGIRLPQVSLGTAAFMAVGAFASFNFVLRVEGIPILLAFALGGVCAALVGIVFGLPSLRIRGFYLAASTLATQFFVVWCLTKVPWFTNNSSSGVITAQKIRMLGYEFDTPVSKYLFVLVVVAVLALLAKNMVRTTVGRSWMAIRDMDVAAEVIGIRPVYAKLSAFAVSSFYVGVAGALWGFIRLGSWEPLAFNLNLSLNLLFMIIIGGMGSIMGSFFGAAFIVVLPILLNQVPAWLGVPISTAMASHLEFMIFGALIVFFLIVEPHGLARLWSIGKEKLRLWPFPH